MKMVWLLCAGMVLGGLSPALAQDEIYFDDGPTIEDLSKPVVLNPSETPREDVAVPLEMTLSAAQSQTAIGEKIPVQIVYKNLAPYPIRVLKVNLWAFPVTFEVQDDLGRRTIISRVPRQTYNVDYYHDFVELAPGETLSREMEISQYFLFTQPGLYRIKAIYSRLFGLPETVSNTVDIQLVP